MTPHPTRPPTGAGGGMDALIVRKYGSYLHNVRPHLPGLCRVCAAPISASYTLCRPCNLSATAAQSVRQLADRIAFMTYAIEGGQAYSALRGYKTPVFQARHWNAVATWTVWFLRRHAPHTHQLAGTAAEWRWATIPSVRSARIGEHPLHRIVANTWATHTEAPLLATQPSQDPARGYDPGRFTAQPLPSGSHVILIDDSWTTGANVQSATTALKAAGAEQVSVMILGRLLRTDWEPTRQFITEGGLTPFDPLLNPW